MNTYMCCMCGSKMKLNLLPGMTESNIVCGYCRDHGKIGNVIPDIRVPNEKGGVKDDSGKLQFSLIPPQTQMSLAKVLTYGARKYTPGNWKNVEIERYIDAFLRHFNAWLQSRDDNDPQLAIDSETGFNHLEHAYTNMMFIVYQELYSKNVKPKE